LPTNFSPFTSAPADASNTQSSVIYERILSASCALKALAKLSRMAIVGLFSSADFIVVCDISLSGMIEEIKKYSISFFIL
jgi:hypothetical protein